MNDLGLVRPRAAAPNVDWRLKERRREVFMDFWEFHLRHRAHPGVVYLLMPYLRDRLEWTPNEALWFAFLNGNTQNPLTSMLLFKASRSGHDPDRMIEYFDDHYSRLAFDTDRRHHKKQLVLAMRSYLQLTGGFEKQEAFWGFTASAGFDAVWGAARSIQTFGRLSAFSYAEYLRIMGVEFDCDTLMLDDLMGSISHRNGLCIVLGLDHLDWHKSNQGFDGSYTWDQLSGLALEGAALLADMKTRAAGESWERDVSYFTLESTLCTYKGWHRVNRRYPGVYVDMLYDRIRAAERAFPHEDFQIFWEARAELPDYVLLEASPNDPGLCPEKQNWYRTTGEVIVMGREYPQYFSGFDRAVDEGGFGRCR